MLNVAAEILRSGTTTPDRPALRVRTASTRYEVGHGELAASVRRFAGALRRLGVSEEQRVLIALPDVPELAIAFLGSIWAGAVPVLVNPGLRLDDYRFFVSDTRARLLVAGTANREAIAAAEGARADGPAVWTVGLGEARERSPFWTALEGAPEAMEPFASHGEDDAFWLYSSGTTGRPKGTVHRHGDIPHVAASYGRHVLQIGRDDLVLSTSRMFFAYGLGASLYLPLGVAASSVISPEPFAPAATWRALREERPTLFFAVPSVYRALLDDSSSRDGRAGIASVRLCISAGEGLPESIYREWRERFGKEIVDGVGSTEALHIYVSNRPGRCRPGTVGVAVPGYDLKIVDEGGNEVACGEPGTMWVRGRSLASRYWRRREASERAFHGAWFVSGDQAVQDADGVFRVLGRTDEMVKIAGQWVSPIDVEEVVREVEGVVECGVVSLPGAADLAELVVCVVAAPTRPGELAEAVARRCAERLPRHSRPKRVVELEALPRTATGKLQRFRLREALAARGPEPGGE